ncbi:hypothetical protein KDM87_14505 [Undibacterium sp. FT147W]|uniref:Uncharacterized protein n=1 Tax=Undibacterium rivi TaxID=2828729 RepID=A0ABS5H4J0_9BURK|nr:hypothetical protein [Undibacterium rivi]MBR7793806.1 hypothetical protein [Undibacterium rivi]
MAKIDDPVKKELKALGKTEAIDMLEWMLNQDRLRIELWYEPRHGASPEKFYQVWTISDDEDFPSGRGATMIQALQQAKAAEEQI